MKLKEISVFEQHFEKVIVGVLLLLFLGVLSMQFLTSPNQVEIGGQKVNPDKAWEPVAREADRLAAAINDPNPSLPEVPDPTIDRVISEKVSQPVLASLESTREFGDLAVALDASSSDVESADSFSGGESIAQVELPGPTGTQARAFMVALDPFDVQRMEGLKDLIPGDQPHDVVAVSVQGKIDGTEIKAALETDPDGDGPIEAIPTSWWRGAVTVLDVRLEREELVNGADWSNTTEIAALPGSYDIKPVLDRDMRSMQDVRKVADRVSRDQNDIMRPAFLPILAGQPWVPPSVAAEASEELTSGADRRTRQIARLKRERAQKLREITSLNSEIETLTPIATEERTKYNEDQAKRNKNKDENKPQTNPRREGGGGETGGGETGGGGRGEPGRENQQEQPQQEYRTPTERRIDRLNERVERLDSQVDRFEDTLTNLGVSFDAADDDESGFDIEDFATVGPLTDVEEANIWAHDITAEPGKTYRYRLRYSIPNPLFKRQTSLPANQANRANAKRMVSAAGEWSDPVETPLQEYYFVRSAKQGDDVSPTRASLEMFKFYYGFWRSTEVELRPGDPILAVVELPAGLHKFEVPADANQPLPELPDAEDAPRRLELASEGWLVDVLASPVVRRNALGQAVESNVEAILGFPDGDLEVRPPSPSESVFYLSLLESAEAGYDQLPPLPGGAQRQGPANQPTRRPNERDPRGVPDYLTPPGGGGGG